MREKERKMKWKRGEKKIEGEREGMRTKVGSYGCVVGMG